MKDIAFRVAKTCRVWRYGFMNNHGRARVTLYMNGTVTVERRRLLLFGWRPFAVGHWKYPDLGLTAVANGASLDDTFWHGWTRERIGEQLHVEKKAERDALIAADAEARAIRDRLAALSKLSGE